MKSQGFTAGAWDLLHTGHMLFLNTCLENCDLLIVGLHWNPKFERIQKNSPIQSMTERAIQLDQFLPEDRSLVIPYVDEADLLTIMQSYRIDVRFLGSDYDRPDAKVTGADLAQIMYIPRLHEFSSSALRRRIAEAERDKD